MTPIADERFWRKVNKNGPIPEKRPDLGPCWLWIGASLHLGYGKVRRGDKMYLAHRVAWVSLRGPIPDELELDHLCRVTNCINPGHLELVTHQQNVLRGVGLAAINAKKTHCPRGHLLDSKNTYRYKDGRRECRMCRQGHCRELKRKRREAIQCVKLKSKAQGES